MLILCMGIALLFWLLTKISKTYTTTLDMAIIYNTPTTKIFKSPPVDVITVDIRAKGWQLLSRYFNHLSPSITLKVASNTTNLNSRLLRQAIGESMPDEIEVLRFMPDNIAVALEPQETKKVPLIATVENSLFSQYQLSTPLHLLPDSVLVVGPRTELQKVKEWYTDSLALKTLLTSPKGSIALRKHQNSKVQFLPKRVDYSAKVEEMTERTLLVPVKLRNCRDSVQLFPRTVQLVCRVGLSRYDDLYASNFEVVADFKNIDIRKAVSVPLTLLKAPNWVHLSGLQPSKADFLVVK